MKRLTIIICWSICAVASLPVVLADTYEDDVRLMRTNPEAWRRKHFGNRASRGASGSAGQTQNYSWNQRTASPVHSTQNYSWNQQATQPAGSAVQYAAPASATRAASAAHTAAVPSPSTSARGDGRTLSPATPTYTDGRTLKSSSGVPADGRKIQNSSRTGHTDGRTIKASSSPSAQTKSSKKSGNKNKKNLWPDWPWDKSKNLDSIAYSNTDKFGIGTSELIREPNEVNVSEWIKKRYTVKNDRAKETIGVAGDFLLSIANYIAVVVAFMLAVIVQLLSMAFQWGSGKRPGLSPTALIVFTVGLIAALVIKMPAPKPALATKLNYVPVHSKEMEFRVMMPEPFVKEQHSKLVGGSGPLLTGNSNKLKLMYTVVGYDGSDPFKRQEVAMSYCSLPSPEAMYKATHPYQLDSPFMKMTYFFDPEKGLDGMVDEIKKSAVGKAKIINVRSIQVDGYPAREIYGESLDKEPREVRIRLICTQHEAYILLAAGDPYWVKSDSYKFFDTFRFDTK